MKPGKINKLIDVLKKPQRFEDVRLENIVETIHTPSTDISFSMLYYCTTASQIRNIEKFS